MQLYYNPDFGYIVCAQTTIRGSVARVIMDPVTVLDPSVSDMELENAIWNSLERSRTARPIDRLEAGKYQFWQVAGFSSFYSFSKQFLCLTVTQVGPTLRLCPLERDPDGGYACPVSYPCIDLPRDRSSGELGAAVRNMFSRRTLLEVDLLNTPEEVQRQIREKFEAMTLSIQIESFKDWSAPPPPPPKAAPDNKNILPKEGKERVFLWVQLALTCIAAAITFYPIYEA